MMGQLLLLILKENYLVKIQTLLLLMNKFLLKVFLIILTNNHLQIISFKFYLLNFNMKKVKPFNYSALILFLLTKKVLHMLKVIKIFLYPVLLMGAFLAGILLNKII